MLKMNRLVEKPTCALCKNRIADKKNTHYLTDAVIRSCFDPEGRSSNKYREMGSYYDVSSNTPALHFGFQRNTSDRIIREKLGRDPTYDEIKEAEHNPYAVDDMFCEDCEDRFGKIEKPFVEKIWPKIKNLSSKNKEMIEITDASEIKTIWMFFILQFWRSHICDSAIILDEIAAETFRKMIFNEEGSLEELVNYPMAVAYIVTSEPKDHTNHFVGLSTGSNPFVIMMNDFVVQLFDSKSSIQYQSLFGLNSEKKYRDFVNYDKDLFKIQIIEKKEWDDISLLYYLNEKVPKIESQFIIGCCKSDLEIVSFRNYIGLNTNPIMLSERMLNRLICTFIIERYPLLLSLYHPEAITK